MLTKKLAIKITCISLIVTTTHHMQSAALLEKVWKHIKYQATDVAGAITNNNFHQTAEAAEEEENDKDFEALSAKCKDLLPVAIRKKILVEHFPTIPLYLRLWSNDTDRVIPIPICTFAETVALSVNGHYLASTHKNEDQTSCIQIWDLREFNKKLLHRFEPKCRVFAVAISSDKEILAYSIAQDEHTTVKVHTIHDNQLSPKPISYYSYNTAAEDVTLTMNSDNSCMIIKGPHTYVCSLLADAYLYTERRAHRSNVAIDPTGNLLATTCALISSLQLSDISTRKEPLRPHDVDNHQAALLTFNNDGTLLATVDACLAPDPDDNESKKLIQNGSISLLKVVAGKVSGKSTIPQHTPSIESLSFSPDSRLLITAARNTIHILNTNTGKAVRRFLIPDRYGTPQPSTGGSHAITRSADGTVRLWTGRTPKSN